VILAVLERKEIREFLVYQALQEDRDLLVGQEKLVSQAVLA
jgi:hypothetical protein